MGINSSVYYTASSAVLADASSIAISKPPVIVPPDIPLDQNPLYADFFVAVGDLLATRDIAYILAAPDEAVARTNIASPGLYTCTTVGNPTYQARGGLTGSLAFIDYWDTGYVPGQGHLQLLDAEIDAFICDNTFDANNGSMEEFGNSFNYLKCLETQLVTGAPTSVGARITRNATQRSANGVVTNAIGMVSAARHEIAPGVRVYKNAVQIAAGGGAANGVGTDSLKIGYNSVRRIGFVSAGSRFSDADRLRWCNAVTALMLKLGAYDPEDLNLPPVPGGADPFAPPASVVWTEAYKGGVLNMAGLNLTHDSTFNSLAALATITPSGGAGPWFAPIHATVGFANFVPPDAPVSPFSIQDGVLRMRMEKVNNVWQTGHMQTADFNGAGFSQTLGYFEAKMKMPPAGTKGAWPAFWLYGQELYTVPSKTRPEIDIIEYYPGGDSRGYHASVHLRPGVPYQLGQVSRHWFKSDYVGMDAIRDNNWHLYGAEITTEWIIIYFDRVELIRIPCQPDQRVPFYMLMSLQGLSDELAQSVPPIDLFVEYVRAWQRN